MLLYKFKGVGDALYALDIAIHQRLYCAKYADLNDPFEGQFRTVVKPRGGDFSLQFGSNFGPPARVVYTDTDLASLTGGKQVCSLTTAWDDVRMWALYGDSFKGLAFEFEIDENHPQLRQVKYVSELPKIPTGLLNPATAEDALSYKTDHWEYEAEWRFIIDGDYVLLPGALRRILLGNRVPRAVKEAVLKVAPAGTTVHMVGLDHEGVRMTLLPALDRG
jgi:hypothetical protein